MTTIVSKHNDVILFCFLDSEWPFELSELVKFTNWLGDNDITSPIDFVGLQPLSTLDGLSIFHLLHVLHIGNVTTLQVLTLSIASCLTLRKGLLTKRSQRQPNARMNHSPL